MKRIQTIFQDDEVTMLEAIAESKGMSLTKYIRSLALNAGVTVELPTTMLIKQHTDEIMELKKMLKPLLQTIADSQYATDADIQNILRTINEISISEKSLLKNVIQMRSDIQKETAKNVKKAVRSQLKKKDTDAA